MMNTTTNNSCNVTPLFNMLSCRSVRCNLCIQCVNGVQNWTCTLELLNGSMKDSCCHGKVQHWLRTDGNKIITQRLPLNGMGNFRLRQFTANRLREIMLASIPYEL